ncbi:TlpA family protein disulfide reductase [Desulforhopalus vacuolatus]|uniref:TlpA family protein disulfide reductase n=1 Tax=Desulforhopalus vacuolatus TaxID=40414 RepID=UPI001963AE57|nr:TlpA disulfide reductase family protein [Desulforhopalus vacuolatus]MBM9519927.1 TlpA family protein disulfide reductase [Desulforhopalus vacuolatus]
MKHPDNMKLRAIMLTLVFLFLTGVAQANTRMPAFSLASAVDGETVDSSSFRGMALLVTFFATYCPPCRLEVNELKELQKEYAVNQFSVVALSMDRGSKGVANFMEERSINYPVLMATMQTSNDFGGVMSIPSAFLVNRDGDVVKRYMGYVGRDIFEKDIKSVLK